MNRKLYGIFLAAVFGASSFLTSCSSSSHKTITTPYAFYLSGQDTLPAGSGNINYYALAGAVTIDSSGNVTAGEQDYNEGFTSTGGISSPEPSGDTISGGTLTVDATGQGTLTLTTNNAALGASGTETLGVQFVNADHALIIQFDGSATSSGSLDLQTLSGTPSGGFAFTLNGVDPNYFPFAVGGVFTLPSATGDVVDLNDDGALTAATPLAVSLGTPDSFGRGTINSTTGLDGVSLNYYVVGPEAIRIIDVDATDAAVGSAFGQGTATGTYTNASLAAAVFAVSSDPFGDEYGVAGEITPDSTPVPAIYSGVAEDVELDTSFTSGLASTVSGTYTLASNGYGSLTISGFGGGNFGAVQVYATDPTLDINDPNNASGNPDVGGALLLEWDNGGPLAGGIGVAVAQTDTTSTDFAGNYAAGWQNFNDFTACGDCEFDMVANGTMASGGALSLTEGLVSDPFETLGLGATTFTGATFTGNPTPDPNPTNAGRLTMLSTDAPPGGALGATIDGASGGFDTIIYQASASQLFWLEYDLSLIHI